MPWRRRRQEDQDVPEPRPRRRDLADLDAGAGGPAIGDVRPARSDVTVRDDADRSAAAPWPPREAPEPPPLPAEQPSVFAPAPESASAAPEPAPGDATLDDAEVARAARAAVRAALDEDLGAVGDLTTLATVPPDAAGRAALVARADGVVAGTALVAMVYDHLDPRVQVELTVQDGDRVRRGDVLGTVTGPLRSVLTGERTALNFLTHLSGIATRTRAFVDAVAGTGCAVRDTRKTTPGLRLLEKAAVRAGGGVNHRVGLSDALLVKDNHVAAAGSVAAATAAALRAALGRHVQVEVTSTAELLEAVEAGARDVLLDNFTPEQVAEAVELLASREERVLLEASGTIRLDNVAAYARAGAHRVAVGALTHSAPQLDIALDVQATASPPRE